ncbi:MAG: PH domain-containing protein [Candidatus Micrarchaeota archaeon]|nr:PH domain-containing protein [Candidatus Micrarchaeota archaeon]
MTMNSEQASNSQYLSLVNEMLLPGEQVALIVRQIRLWPIVSLNSVIKPKVIFATNKRVIIVARPALGLGRSTSIFPYTIIRAIKITRGIRFYTISLSHEGSVADTGTDEPRFVNGLNHDDAVALEKYINEQIDLIGPHDNQIAGHQNPMQNKIRCVHCGNMNEIGFEYCSSCGNRL